MTCQKTSRLTGRPYWAVRPRPGCPSAVDADQLAPLRESINSLERFQLRWLEVKYFFSATRISITITSNHLK